MDVEIYSCLICGWGIGNEDRSVSWASEFRGLYKIADGDLVFTGVGHYDPIRVRAFVASPDPSVRWDDAGYANPPEDRFGAMMQKSVDSRYGFAFHDACWSLLEKAYHPRPIPLQRVYDVCSSLPFPWHAAYASWEHDYGGLISVQKEDQFPWLSERPGTDLADEGEAPAASFADCNPFDVPEVQGLLQDPPQPPPLPPHRGDEASPERLSALGGGGDCFCRLPTELCIEIAKILSVADALSARMASRSFWPVLHSQSFWMSRFRHANNRSWLFEAVDGPRSRDWRWLHRQTADSHLTPALRNRKRVWALIMHMMPALDLVYHRSPSSPAQDQREVKWNSAAARLIASTARRERPLLGERCNATETLWTPVLHDISQFTFFFVSLGDFQYVSGLRVTTPSGYSLLMGYASDTSSRVEGLSRVSGFRVAVSTRGIRAVQICLHGQNMSPWQGDPAGCSVARIPADPALGLRLSAAFDGCKLVALSAGMPHHLCAHLQDWRSLESAYWFPDRPAPHLFLNEDPLSGRIWPWAAHRPVFWASFGGPQGAYLKHLTMISVTSTAHVHEIEFRYGKPGSPGSLDCPDSPIRLGRPAYYQDHADPARIPESKFSIDGPGGEFINKIHAYSNGIQPTRLACFQIFTNKGRCCLFGSEANLEAPYIRELAGAPGTTITGLYTCLSYNPGDGLSWLGVISEKIEKGGCLES